VPDPRASDEAWAVTVPAVADLGTFAAFALPQVVGADDARRAAWLRADSYPELVTDLATCLFHGQVFRAHVAMLRDFLGGQS
jgi:ADP-ribose diphosphatase